MVPAARARGAERAPARSAPDGGAGQAGDLDGRLWALAQKATGLRVKLPEDSPLAPALAEAVACLQDLSLGSAPAGEPDNFAARLDALGNLQAQLGCAIHISPNGPYLVTNAASLRDWLGEELPVRPQMALCRCGGSANKPFCDGTHARIGFGDEKDPKRVPDRLDTYAGLQLTILDNRGTCQHSGFCTDRLASVFRAAAEPFVAPSGGRMDEIIRAVRDCPSGALGYAIDGVEMREQVDWDGTREPVIEVTRDGPYRITGSIPLSGALGEDVARTAAASHEHYALCRCGHSQNKPFCSGMHWYVDFEDPLPDPDAVPTLFEWCGGLPALTRMTRIFYEKHVPEDELLAPLFANMAPDHPQRVARWLAEVFGGPTRYSEEHGGYERMVSQHLGKALTEEARARWVALISLSAEEAGLPSDPEFRAAFISYLEWGSRLALENSQPGAKPPLHMPMPRWWWACDATPSSRVPALDAEGEGEQIALPAEDEPVGFEPHIKSLFRDRDRRSMQFAFDLGSHADVSAHAEGILERLQDGSMPCDGAWPPDRIAVFRRWVQQGKAASAADHAAR
jgi:CDGSH-type Zn-finger protein/truncated hemoglobin YjbI